MFAIIPARGGSKGLPGKNIMMLNGKPLISYTIEAAMKSKNISEVIVSTDDIKIAEISKKYGASVPFIRPDYLSGDNAGAIDVYLHAIEYLIKERNDKIDKFLVLLPTAPLRNENHIDEAIMLFEREQACSLISVCEAEIPPSWYYRVDENKRLFNAGFDQSKALSNRQDNYKYYIPNGAIYILDYKGLKEDRTYYSNNTIPYVMKHEDSIDIDNLIDFRFAEFLISL
jgi:CMP-N,N'-diacetyllegionaminic acid synthase